MRSNCKPLTKLFRPIILLIVALLGSVQVYAQSKISGTVVDSKGEPIYGATIIVTGTTNGTISDFDGNFTINASAGTPLTISFLGYETAMEVAAAGMKVTLQDESQQIEDIQVIAYGAQKKVTVTGAISSVKSEDLVRTPVASVNNVLAGQLSGVTTVQYSGEPGSDAASVFVRGKASFGDSNPLVQVDGVERSMTDIDPNEIESITVLKDASATAVFGVRGANGVILITTKRGQEGKANINVSTAFSALTPTKMVPMASSYDYATFYNQALKNDDPNAAERFKPEIIQKFKDGSDPIRFPSMDWADYIMKQFTLQTQSNLSISGGNDKVKYFVSAGMFTQGGLFEEFDLNYHLDYRYKRYNYRSNIDINVTKYTAMAIGVSGMIDRTMKPITGQGSSGMIKNIYYSTPFSSPGIVDGKFITNTNKTSDNADGLVLPFIGGNGMAYYLTGGCYKADNNRMSFDLGINQKFDMFAPLKGLVFRLKGAYNTSFYNQRTIGGGSVATWTPVLKEDGTMLFRKSGEDRDPVAGSTNLGKGRDWYFESAIDYKRSFGSHNLTGLVLYNQSKQYYLGSYSDIPRTYVGFVARVVYDYQNKYMADFSYGRNGSENFASDRRYGSFPAGSAGWNLTEEAFMENLKPYVSFLKIRGSWGSVGNDKMDVRFAYTPDPYVVKNNSVTDHDGTAYLFGESTTYTAATTGIVTGTNAQNAKLNNAVITWEKAFKQDYGIDINFMDDQFKCTFDYYKENRKDILASSGAAPSILGFQQPNTNLGKVDSWGWEASVAWNKTFNDDWRVWAKFNISYNQNEIIVDGQGPQQNEFQYTKGRRIGSRSQLKFWKLYQPGISEEQYQKEFGVAMPEQSFLKGGARAGDAIFVDLDGNGVVDANDNTRDLGYTDDPQYTAGLNLGFSFKRLSFNTQITGAWNVSRMISDVFRRPFTNAAGFTEGGLLQYHVDETFSEDKQNYDAKYPRATFTNGDQNYATSTLYEQDSKYMRVKTAELSYDFDFPWMKTVGLKRFQMAVNGYNLLTFTPFLWGDPETRQSNAPSYPLQRTYTASVRLNF